MVRTLLVIPTPPRQERSHRYQIGIHEAILPDRCGAVKRLAAPSAIWRRSRTRQIAALVDFAPCGNASLGFSGDLAAAIEHDLAGLMGELTSGTLWVTLKRFFAPVV